MPSTKKNETHIQSAQQGFDLLLDWLGKAPEGRYRWYEINSPDQPAVSADFGKGWRVCLYESNISVPSNQSMVGTNELPKFVDAAVAAISEWNKEYGRPAKSQVGGGE